MSYGSIARYACIVAQLWLALLHPREAGAQPLAYIANFKSESVSVIDTATNTVLGPPIKVGVGPISVVVTADGLRAYVTNLNSNFISVIDTTTSTASPVALSVKSFGLAITPDGTRAYLSNNESGRISVVDITTNTAEAQSITGSSIDIALIIKAVGYALASCPAP